MKTLAQIMDELKPILAETLAVEPGEVTPAARIFEDLGAESIDALDLAFRCERWFGVKIPLQQMAAPGDLATDEAGRLTPEALALFKQRFPFLDYSTFEADPLRNRMTELLTVTALARLVAAALEEGESDEASRSATTAIA